MKYFGKRNVIDSLSKTPHKARPKASIQWTVGNQLYVIYKDKIYKPL